MGIRDLVLIIAVVAVIPMILWRPYVGILAWSWISYMNPHRLTYGVAYNMPFAQIVAITLFLSLLFNREKLRLQWSGLLLLWLLFIFWMVITSQMAIYPHLATGFLTNVLKIQLITWLTMVLITDRERLTQLLWVIVASIGFYSVKGGFFTLITGGAYRVYGPGGSNIAENNALALATLMIVPLMIYLREAALTSVWAKRVMATAIFASIVSAVGSQSRGALIAIAAVGAIYWWRSKTKFASGFALVVIAGILLAVMPQSWEDRMSSISNFEQDKSAMGRIHAWQYAISIASDRFTGGGFNSWSDRTYDRYAPQSVERVVAHSIYFSVLADHGWPGLLLFAWILFLVWRRLSRIHAAGDPPDDGFRPATLARMLQISLVAYCSGGAFLSLSYFDLPWHIFAITVILDTLQNRPEVLEQPATGKAAKWARNAGR